MKKISKGSPALSVAIVNYNASDLLADCVQAVLASPVDLEVVISDNGSTDGSLTHVRRHHGEDPRLTILEHGSNLGFARGNNLALAHTRAPYMLILNPDCIVGPDSFGRPLDFMDATPDAGMAGCMIRNPDGSEQRSARRQIPIPWIGLTRFLQFARNGYSEQINDPLPEGPIPVEAVSGALMLVRRATFDEVGLLDEGYFLHCEDLDWFVRFRRAGWKLYLVPDVEVVHHQGSCSTGRPIAVEWYKHKGMVRFFRKFQFRAYPFPFSVLVIIGIWAHFGLFLGAYGLRRVGRGRRQ